MYHPTIEVITGCMFSGKSEELLRCLKRHEIAGHTLLVIKPELDTRVESCIKSRNGSQFSAITVKKPEKILTLIDNVDVVGIDEAHFFSPELSSIVIKLINLKKTVLIAGLDTDFHGNPFETTALLMALAHRVTKLTAICAVCKSDIATRNQLLITSDGNRFHVGDSEYEPRCTICFSPPTKV